MIYFLWNEAANRLKIGFSKDPEARIAQLMTGSSNALQLLHVADGSLRQERHVQTILAKWRTADGGTEWFKFVPPVRRFLELTMQFGLLAAIAEYEAKQVADDCQAPSLKAYQKPRQQRQIDSALSDAIKEFIAAAKARIEELNQQIASSSDETRFRLLNLARAADHYYRPESKGWVGPMQRQVLDNLFSRKDFLS